MSAPSPPALTAADVLRRRLAVQRLPVPGRPTVGLPSALEVVRLLTCVQSQEQAHALWSLGIRTTGLDEVAVRAELDDARFVRTHILRPTWHFVAAADLRWILTLTSPRVQQTNGSQYRKLGITPAILDRGAGLLLDALAGRRYLTRPELAAVLAEGGIESSGERLAAVVMNAELEGLICSGPTRGSATTYAVVDERVPPSAPLSADAMLAELTWRFFSGHGPAELRDFTRWSSLTLTQARAGLELVGDRLQRVTVEDLELWYDPELGGPLEEEAEAGTDQGPGAGSTTAVLAPLYDELTLSYPRLHFPVVPGHPHPPGGDTFTGSVLVSGENVGTWRRTLRGRRVSVETWLDPALSAEGRAAVSAEVRRLASFLGRELEELSPTAPPPGIRPAPPA